MFVCSPVYIALSPVSLLEDPYACNNLNCSINKGPPLMDHCCQVTTQTGLSTYPRILAHPCAHHIKLYTFMAGSQPRLYFPPLETQVADRAKRARYYHRWIFSCQQLNALYTIFLVLISYKEQRQYQHLNVPEVSFAVCLFHFSISLVYTSTHRPENHVPAFHNNLLVSLNHWQSTYLLRIAADRSVSGNS